MDVILHIGPYKTGTTAIQHALWRNRARLAAEGWLYPAAPEVHFAHHRLRYALVGMVDPLIGDVPDLDVEMGAIGAEVAARAPRGLVVSSETFFGLRRAHIRVLVERLVEQLGGDRITVVAALRHPLERVFSLYNQQVKNPANAYKRSLDSVLRAPCRHYDSLDMRRSLGLWAGVVGPANLRLVEYRGRSAVPDFLAASGLPGGLDLPRGRLNEGVDARAAEVIRLAKRRGLSPEEVARIAALARAAFPGSVTVTALPRRRLEALAADLCPRYDAVFEAHLGRPNPYSADVVPDLLARAVPALTTGDLVEILARPPRVGRPGRLRGLAGGLVGGIAAALRRRA